MLTRFFPAWLVCTWLEAGAKLCESQHAQVVGQGPGGDGVYITRNYHAAIGIAAVSLKGVVGGCISISDKSVTNGSLSRRAHVARGQRSTLQGSFPHLS